MISIPMGHGGDSRPTMTIKTGPTASLTPLGLSSNLERFSVCAVHCPLKLSQGPPLGVVAPPDGKPKASY